MCVCCVCLRLCAFVCVFVSLCVSCGWVCVRLPLDGYGEEQPYIYDLALTFSYSEGLVIVPLCPRCDYVECLSAPPSPLSVGLLEC